MGAAVITANIRIKLLKSEFPFMLENTMRNVIAPISETKKLSKKYPPIRCIQYNKTSETQKAFTQFEPSLV